LHGAREIRNDEFGDPYLKGPKGQVRSVRKGRFYLPDNFVTSPGDGFLLSLGKKAGGDLSFCEKVRPGVLFCDHMPTPQQAAILAVALNPPKRPRGRPRKPQPPIRPARAA
jgi:hypothetical protein